jgi:hypothetical protein
MKQGAAALRIQRKMCSNQHQMHKFIQRADIAQPLLYSNPALLPACSAAAT